MQKHANSFRTKECNALYDAYKLTPEFSRGCVLCAREAVREFSWWKIIVNKFPYDRVASVHDMLVPKRHVTEDELSEDEKRELREIKRTELHDYQFIIEPTPNVKSIPAHFHLHLIVSKDDNSDLV